MSHKVTGYAQFLDLSQELLAMIFAFYYNIVRISFDKGLFLGVDSLGWDSGRHLATNLESWVTEECIKAMLICKTLKPIAWEAFLKKTLFSSPGHQMMRRTAMRRNSWWDMKLAKDPTDHFRRLKSDLNFAEKLVEHWPAASNNLLPNLKELSITGRIMTNLDISGQDPFYISILAILRDVCREMDVKFNAYLTLVNFRPVGTGRRHYPQTILVIIREDGTIRVKEVRLVQAAYNAVSQHLKDKFGQELPEMEVKKGSKLLRYFDKEMDYEFS